MTFPWLLRFDMPHIVDFHWVSFLTLLTSVVVDAHFCSSPGSFLLLRSQLQHRLLLVQFSSFAISPASYIVSCIHFDSLVYCSPVPSFVLYLVSVPLAAALSPATCSFMFPLSCALTCDLGCCLRYYLFRWLQLSHLELGCFSIFFRRHPPSLF